MLLDVWAASDDRELDERIVTAFAEFLSRCTRGHALVEASGVAHSLPSYLVGLMNTAYLTAEEAPITETALRAANPGSEKSRMGDEHWSVLVAKGFAQEVGSGWRLTLAGVAVVMELHARLGTEVSLRKAPLARVTGLRKELEPMAEAMPRVPRIEIIRRLWKNEATEIALLYRIVWELYIYRRILNRDAFIARWPREQLRAIADDLTKLTADLD